MCSPISFFNSNPQIRQATSSPLWRYCMCTNHPSLLFSSYWSFKNFHFNLLRSVWIRKVKTSQDSFFFPRALLWWHCKKFYNLAYLLSYHLTYVLPLWLRPAILHFFRIINEPGQNFFLKKKVIFGTFTHGQWEKDPLKLGVSGSNFLLHLWLVVKISFTLMVSVVPPYFGSQNLPFIDCHWRKLQVVKRSNVSVVTCHLPEGKAWLVQSEWPCQVTLVLQQWERSQAENQFTHTYELKEHMSICRRTLEFHRTQRTV